MRPEIKPGRVLKRNTDRDLKETEWDVSVWMSVAQCRHKSAAPVTLQ